MWFRFSDYFILLLLVVEYGWAHCVTCQNKKKFLGSYQASTFFIQIPQRLNCIQPLLFRTGSAFCSTRVSRHGSEWMKAHVKLQWAAWQQKLLADWLEAPPKGLLGVKIIRLFITDLKKDVTCDLWWNTQTFSVFFSTLYVILSCSLHHFVWV